MLLKILLVECPVPPGRSFSVCSIVLLLLYLNSSPTLGFFLFVWVWGGWGCCMLFFPPNIKKNLTYPANFEPTLCIILT